MTADDREAIASLAARIRQRDGTDPSERPDPEVLATEYVAAMRANGWRPTAAAPASPDADWRNGHRPAGPDVAHQRAAEIRSRIRREAT